MPTQKLTPEIINAAIFGFESQKTKIDAQIAELRAMLPGSSAQTATPEPTKRKRRKMSAAGRKAIAEAQRKRWAESKGTAEPPASEAPKPKRKLSAAGRNAIIAATKKRWEAVRAAKAQQERGAAKKGAPKKAAPKKAAPKKAAAKKIVGKKTATKRTAPAAAQGATETAG